MLQTGLGYDQSPITDATRSPRLPDNNRIPLSVGITYDLIKSVLSVQGAAAAPVTMDLFGRELLAWRKRRAYFRLDSRINDLSSFSVAQRKGSEMAGPLRHLRHAGSRCVYMGYSTWHQADMPARHIHRLAAGTLVCERR